MARKLSLPLLNLGRGSALTAISPDARGKATVDAIRKRLGGRASTEPGAGDLITLTTPDGGALQGVILFARGDDVDVWIEQPEAAATTRTGVVHHARRADVAPPHTPARRALNAVALDARAFGALVEGQRVRYQNDAGLGEGMLVEKCRFGGLVQRDDGTLLGVGFRRLWPAQPGGAYRH